MIDSITNMGVITHTHENWSNRDYTLYATSFG